MDKPLNEAEIEHLTAVDLDHMIHPQFSLRAQRDAVIYASGQGAILTDVHGKQYIDGLASLWNVAVGHGRAELAEAAAAQMRELAFSNSYTGYANIPAIRLTERLLGLVHSNMSGVFYVNSGSEANELAVKAARYFWHAQGKPEKVKIISRQEAYHGGTMAATAMTGMAAFHARFGPEPPGFLRAPTCYRYRCQWCANEPACTLECADAVEEAIQREGAGTVAAVIAEPVHGAGGVIPPDPGYWPRLREICDRHDVLLIADEVITGFGRTGRWFALEHWGVQPDLMTVAKAITSAYVPLAALIASQRVHDVILREAEEGALMVGYTNSGHPTACAVALRNLQIIEDEGLVGRAEQRGQRLNDGLRRLLETPYVGDVRGLGLMAAVEIVADKQTREAFPAEERVGARVIREMREQGLITRAKGDSVLFAPPLVVGEEEIDRIVDITAQAIDSVTAQVG